MQDVLAQMVRQTGVFRYDPKAKGTHNTHALYQKDVVAMFCRFLPGMSLLLDYRMASLFVQTRTPLPRLHWLSH